MSELYLFIFNHLILQLWGVHSPVVGTDAQLIYNGT